MRYRIPKTHEQQRDDGELPDLRPRWAKVGYAIAATIAVALCLLGLLACFAFDVWREGVIWGVFESPWAGEP